MFKQSKVTFTWLNKVCKLVLSNTSWREYTLHAQNYGFQTYRETVSFLFFLQCLTRQILCDNTRLETLVCQVKATSEISKRRGN